DCWRKQRSARLPRRGKTSLQIPLQIGDIFQTDLKPDDRPAFRRLGDLAIREIGHDGQALVAAPGIAQSEDPERVEKGKAARLMPGRVRLSQHDGEESRRALEVALPDLVSLEARQR